MMMKLSVAVYSFLVQILMCQLCHHDFFTLPNQPHYYTQIWPNVATFDIILHFFSFFLKQNCKIVVFLHFICSLAFWLDFI